MVAHIIIVSFYYVTIYTMNSLEFIKTSSAVRQVALPHPQQDSATIDDSQPALECAAQRNCALCNLLTGFSLAASSSTRPLAQAWCAYDILPRMLSVALRLHS